MVRLSAPPAETAATADAQARHKMIAEAAYQRAAERAFSPGQDVEDWLAAERDVDATLGFATLRRA